MNAPVVGIFFESNGNSSLLGRWPAVSVKTALSEPYKLSLQRSFGTIAIVIEGARPELTHLLLNGHAARLNHLGGVLMCRFSLSYDIEMHRIAFVQVPDAGCTIDIEVVHEQEIIIAGSRHLMSKWTREDYFREFERYRKVLAQKQQTLPDHAVRGLKFGSSSDLNSAIVQIVGNLSHIISSLRTFELLADFSKMSPVGIDRERVLSYLKQDPRRLVNDENGSIVIGSNRYSTDVDIRSLGRSAHADMNAIVTLIEECAVALQKSSAPAVTAVMLNHIAGDLRFRFSSRGTAPATQIDSVLSRRMHSPIGAELQSQLRLLTACVQERNVRDAQDQGLLWLQQGIRDFDVFQATALHLVVSALGFDQSIGSTNGKYHAEGLVVLNGNRAEALDKFFELTAGWRSTSVQPSSYRPDIVVIFEENLPIILDAKFAISWSDQLPLPAGPMKEIQAYLDEFDLPGAILIIPKVANQAFVSDGLVRVEGTNRAGKERLLIGVPLQNPTSHAEQQALRNAIKSIADLSSKQSQGTEKLGTT